MTVSMCMSSLFVIGTAVLVIVGQCCLDGLWYHTPLLWPEMLMLFASVRIVGICNIDVPSACLTFPCVCFCHGSSRNSPFDITFPRAPS